MGKKDRGKVTRWVTVPVEDQLHGDVRAEGVRRHKPWPVIMDEAMRMWLSSQKAA